MAKKTGYDGSLDVGAKSDVTYQIPDSSGVAYQPPSGVSDEPAEPAPAPSAVLPQTESTATAP